MHLFTKELFRIAYKIKYCILGNKRYSWICKNNIAFKIITCRKLVICFTVRGWFRKYHILIEYNLPIETLAAYQNLLYISIQLAYNSVCIRVINDRHANKCTSIAMKSYRCTRCFGILEAVEDERVACLKCLCGVHQTSLVRCADTKVKSIEEPEAHRNFKLVEKPDYESST